MSGILPEYVRRQNLRKLAIYLANLPDDCKHFDMYMYCYNSRTHCDINPADVADVENECGTVACALGHGPAAGILPKREQSWVRYGMINFYGADQDDTIHTFLFGGTWKNLDNTAKGAAKRIYWYLEHGVPQHAYEQMDYQALNLDELVKS